jgi:hypothetical protein
MFVQSAELHIVGIHPRLTLEVSCQLSNIARGSCVLSLHPVDTVPLHTLGQIQVPINRPVMHGELSISRSLLDLLRSELRHTSVRPASILLALDEEIAVTSLGDLWIDKTTTLTVRDMSVILPLA